MTIAMTPLLQYHQHQGFPLTASGEAVVTFGNDADISQDFSNGCLLYDQSHWGLLNFTGADRQRYLHNQSTNQIQQLQSGQSCDTVLVNSTARTIDLATVHILDDALWVQVSPQKKTFLLEWFDRFLFPMDKVEISDLSGQFNILSLMGVQAKEILEKLTGVTLADFPAGGHQFLEIQGQNILCATGNSLKLPGYTLYIPAEAGVEIWQALMNLGMIPCGEAAWEKLRIHQGRPAPDQELTEDYNPLEAGLWDCISFDKGCYIGQETIARLNTYKGVKQRLFGIQLSAPVAVPCKIFVGEERAGVITSIDPDNTFALGYVRTKVGGEGLEVAAGEVTGKVVAVPYVTHAYPEP
ncbi:CAF17-like 4Fe-4S cluster assembly/insertion protein YgfZ [Synechococcus sp. BDU 130192]|uniref:CAF17-like 4Fe-4S cluster assembly/insertion protein YgfZ n=1 Tax=Synechococcus sp. BDU 130192 TaxID=2042059 RepID=UPI000C068481|nr:folate-binding protein YgfZ [Synechococcus sp. BDU 130192]